MNITMCGYRCDLCKAFADRFVLNEYKKYLLAYDNKTRLNQYIEEKKEITLT